MGNYVVTLFHSEAICKTSHQGVNECHIQSFEYFIFFLQKHRFKEHKLVVYV